MANNPPKKGGIFRAYLNFNVLYKILIGLVIGAVAGVILAANGITALPPWLSMLGTIFTRLLKMIIIPMIVGSLVVGASSVSPANVGKVGIRIILIYLATSAVGVIIGLLMAGPGHGTGGGRGGQDRGRQRLGRHLRHRPHKRPDLPGQRDGAAGHLLRAGLRPLPLLHEDLRRRADPHHLHHHVQHL